jgi:L-fuculose-phosphate aldolase
MNEKMKIKTQLVKYGKKIAERKLVVGPGGNISARAGEVVFMKASGIAFEEAEESDYIGVELHTGKVVEGDLKPTCEIQMHLACYLIREDVRAVIHTHPPLSTAVAMGGGSLKAFTPDFAALVGPEVPVVEYVIPAGKELAEAVKQVVSEHNGVLLANHGLLTVGANLKEAYYRTLLIEDACKSLLAANVLGKMQFFTPEQMAQIIGLEAERYRKSLLESELPKEGL